jgi:hypothetical protein
LLIPRILILIKNFNHQIGEGPLILILIITQTLCSNILILTPAIKLYIEIPNPRLWTGRCLRLSLSGTKPPCNRERRVEGGGLIRILTLLL